MAVPTTNILFTDIATTADVNYTGILSLNTMSFFSYFTGPNGSGNEPYNNWGQGEASGANRIYLTTAKTTNIKVGDFSGLDYFYDGTNYQIDIRWVNNSPTPTTPPDPPDAYDMDVRLTLYDSSQTYQYISYAAPLTSNGGSTALDIITTTPPQSIPLIRSLYWVLDIQTSPGYPGGAGNRTVGLDINGTTYFSGQTITNGANSWDYNTYGTPIITPGAPSAGNTTGSFWDLGIF